MAKIKHNDLMPGVKSGLRAAMANKFRNRPIIFGRGNIRRFEKALDEVQESADPWKLHGKILPKRLYNKGPQPIAWRIHNRKPRKDKHKVIASKVGSSVALSHMPEPHTKEAYACRGAGYVDFSPSPRGAA